MVMADQEARNRLAESMRRGDTSVAMVREIYQIDRDNTGKLKLIIAMHGWPKISSFGKEAAHLAWLLVQHADAEPKFQQECLDLMEPLLAKKEVSGSDFAYLFDRVACAQGRKQRYGTQLSIHGLNGRSQSVGKQKVELKMKPVEDPKRLDKRRRAVGLMPMAEYMKMAREMYSGG